MNFNDDDPLGDLLSDGSDDSFFAPKKKPTAKTTTSSNVPTTTGGAKSKMENLFGIKNDDSTTTIKTASAPPITAAQKITPIKQRNDVVPKKESSATTASSVNNPTKKDIFADDDDIFADLGFDPKKPKSSAVKKTNLFDDLLQGTTANSNTESSTSLATGINKAATPIPSNRTTLQSGTVPTALTPAKTPLAAAGRPTRARQTPAGDEDTNANRKTPIVQRKVMNDPLGFFGVTESPAETTEKPAAVVKKKGQTSDWLGLGDSGTTSAAAAVTQSTETLPTSAVPNNSTAASQSLTPNVVPSAQILMARNNISDTSLNSLQQHETQLMVAVQMKNQELALIEMKRKQNDLLVQQEQHFNELLQSQLKRQTDLEHNIQWQQERINSHIHMLMAPAPSSGIDISGAKMVEKIAKTAPDDNATSEVEKERLESMVNILKVNHDQEMDLLEKSHRKQIELLEENLSNTERRLRDDAHGASESFNRTVEQLTAEKAALIVAYEAKIVQLETNYTESLVKLKTHHLQELDEIQKEHRSMIENIRQSKKLEFALVQENSSYLTTLRAASGYLETATEDLQTMRSDFEVKIDQLQKEREIQLDAREKRVEHQQQHLDRVKAATETERIALLELVRSLEIKLNSVTQSSEEEQWSIRQQRATLDAERKSFERERDFAREQFAHDQKRIEDLKVQQQDAAQRQQEQIQHERLSIIAEKSKLETLDRLKRPLTIDNDLRNKAEVDAAIQVAKDAANECDRERASYMEKQRALEARRRQFVDQEMALRNRETELDAAVADAQAKSKAADARATHCKSLEMKFSAKMTQLQRQWQEMVGREQKLADERLEMSRERLEMQALTRRLSETRCSLCKIGDRTKELADLMVTSDDGVNGEPPPNRRDTATTDAILNHDMKRYDVLTESRFSSAPLPIADQIDYDDDDLLLARFNVMNFGFMD